MTRDCIEILKTKSPELHKFLAERSGVFDGSDKSKQAYIQAARELQDHSLNTINDIYARVGAETLTPKTTQNALQKRQTEEILQRTQEGTGEQGSGRGPLEQGKQGQEVTKEKEEDVLTAAEKSVKDKLVSAFGDLTATEKKDLTLAEQLERVRANLPEIEDLSDTEVAEADARAKELLEKLHGAKKPQPAKPDVVIATPQPKADVPKEAKGEDLLKEVDKKDENFDSIKSAVSGKTFTKAKVSISDLISKDEDLQDYLNDKDNKETKGRLVEKPIIVGDISRGGEVQKGGVIDGFHRIAQAVANGETTIDAFVEKTTTPIEGKKPDVPAQPKADVPKEGKNEVAVVIKDVAKNVEDILGVSNEDAEALSIIYSSDLTPAEKKILYRQYSNGVMNMQDVKNYAGVLDMDKIRSGDIDKWARAELSKRESRKGKGGRINAEDISFEEIPSTAQPKADVPKVVEVNESQKEAKNSVKGTTVADENGEPIVVYHGTQRKFKTFELPSHFGNAKYATEGGAEMGMTGKGIFFSSKEEAAKSYSELDKKKKTSFVIKAYLDIKKPYIIDAEGKGWTGRIADEYKIGLRNKDYDGVIVKNVIDAANNEKIVGTVYAVKDPSQIKVFEDSHFPQYISRPPVTPKAPVKRFTQKIAEKAKSELDDLFDELNDLANKSGITPNPEDEVKKSILSLKIVAKATEAGIYKFADIVAFGFDKLGKNFDALFSYVRKAYLSYQAEASDEILAKMDNTAEVRNFSYDQFKNDTGTTTSTGTGRVDETGDQVVEGKSQRPIPPNEKEGGTNAVGDQKSTNGQGNTRAEGEPSSSEPGAGTSTGKSTIPITGNEELNADLGGESKEQPIPEPIEETPVITPLQHNGNFVIPPDFTPPKSFNVSQKVQDNIDAIKVLVTLKKEKRKATYEEQKTLFKYVGWGGLKEIGFDPDSNSGWVASNEGLKPKFRELHKVLLELDEYDAAENLEAMRGSIKNAHYTAIPIIRAMYNVVRKAGFKGGRVIEPSSGIGHFIGAMPIDMLEKSEIGALEKDNITGAILKALYPNRSTKVIGYEEISVGGESSADLVISNIPFGDYSVFDPSLTRSKDKQFKASQKKIHSYFFARALHDVKPNGIVAFITSTGVLDSAINSDVRKLISERAEFMGAFRIPNDAFKGNANTSVTTDIIFLRKFGETEDISQKHNFLKTKKQKVKHKNKDQKYEVTYNEYFHDNPEMILGTVEAGSMYGASKDNLTDAMTVTPAGIDLEAKITELADRIVGDKIRDNTSDKTKDAANAYIKDEGQKAGNIVKISDGVYGIVTDEVAINPELDAKAKEMGINPDDIRENNLYDADYVNLKASGLTVQDFKLKRVIPARIPKKFQAAVVDLIPLRTALNQLYAAEYGDLGADFIEGKRSDLNTTYKTFVKNHGTLLLNKPLLNFDVDGHNLAALENVKDKKVVGLADIFTKRVFASQARAESASNIGDAISLNLSETGSLDLGRLAELLKTTPEEVIKMGSGIIFKNPMGEFETKDKYLSGDVRQKLAEAKIAAQSDVFYEQNVAALEAVQPVDLTASQIYAPISAPWIANKYINEFASHLFKQNIIITRLSTGRVNVDGGRSNTEVSDVYGTSRKDGFELLEEVLQNRLPIVTDTIDKKTVVNETETGKAVEKAEKIKKAFAQWIWLDDARRNDLVNHYNVTYNNVVLRKYDGSHLIFEGYAGKHTPMPHQKDGVWMITQQMGGILDHIVGSGKTLLMVLAANKMKRMGLIKKPIIIGLKTNAEDLARAYKDSFPLAKVLYPRAKDFTPDFRKAFFAKMANNDWDAIVMTHDQFGMIEQSKEVREEIISNEIQALEDDIRSAKDNNMSKRDLYGLEVRKQNLQTKLQALASMRKDPALKSFEEMGIDFMFVDESQQFKNLQYSTIQRGVSGLGDPLGADKAFNMLFAIRTLQKRWGADKGTVFASGTPISNTMVEMYLLFKYLRPNKLLDMGINSFDNWANTFASIGSEIEFGVTNSLKPKVRMREFMNIPEMAAMYREIADVRNDSNLDLDKPKFKQTYRLKTEKEIANGEIVTIGSQKFKSIGKIKGLEKNEYYISLMSIGKDPEIPKSGEIDYEGGKVKYSEYTKSDGLLVNIAPTTDQRRFAKAIQRFAETKDGSHIGMPNLSDKKKKAYMLLATTLAAKMAIDMRLINPSNAGTEVGKLGVAANTIVDHYKESNARKGIQLVFSDLGTPKSVNTSENLYDLLESRGIDQDTLVQIFGEGPNHDKPSYPKLPQLKAKILEVLQYTEEQFDDAVIEANEDTFNIYQDMKNKLVKRGIPADEIVFIHDYKTDAKRKILFEDSREGRVRVIIGSTAKLGTGVNVQTKIVAMHHLDVPWRPSDMEQRNGRGVRQGNEIIKDFYDNELPIYYYATEATLDAYKYQLLDTKQRFIDQGKTGEGGVREISEGEGDEENGVSYAAMTAMLSGNPVILEKAKVDKQVKELDASAKAFEQEKFSLKDKIARIKINQKNEEEYLSALKKDKALFDANAKRNEKTGELLYTATIGGEEFTERKKAGEKLWEVRDAFVAEYNKKHPDAKNTDWFARSGNTTPPMEQVVGKINGFDIVIRMGVEREDYNTVLSKVLLVPEFSVKSPVSYERQIELLKTREKGVNVVYKWTSAKDAVSLAGHLQREIRDLQTDIDSTNNAIELYKKDIADKQGYLESLPEAFPRQKEYDAAIERQAKVEAALKEMVNKALPTAAILEEKGRRMRNMSDLENMAIYDDFLDIYAVTESGEVTKIETRQDYRAATEDGAKFYQYVEGDTSGPQFSIREKGDQKLEDTADIIKEYMDEGIKTDLESITDSIIKLAGKDTQKLRDQIKEAFDYYNERYIPKEIHTAVVDRIKETFGKLLDAGVHVYENAVELLKAAEQYKNPAFMFKEAILGAIAMLQPMTISNSSRAKTEQVSKVLSKDEKAVVDILNNYYKENEEIPPKEVIDRALYLWDKFGRPEILGDSTAKNERAYATEDGIKTTLGNITNFDEFIAELSHAAQYVSGKELDDKQYATEALRDSLEYKRKGSTEYNAHTVIEPILARYIFQGDSSQLNTQSLPVFMWARKFPDVIQQTNGATLKAHPSYDKAKTGGTRAAATVVNDLVKEDKLRQILKGNEDAIIVPVLAVEDKGNNKLPLAYAAKIAKFGGNKIASIFQTNKTKHTGAPAMARLVATPKFRGRVTAGKTYILADDFVTSGSTVRALKEFIENKGGKVVLVTSLANASNAQTGYGGTLAIQPETVEAIKEKFKINEFNSLLSQYGIAERYTDLTNSQARYLLSFGGIDRIRTSLNDAGLQTVGRGIGSTPNRIAGNKVKFQVLSNSDEVLGFTAPDGSIHLNGAKLNGNTPVHEGGHLWIKWAQQYRPQLYEKGMSLTDGSKYLKDVKADQNYINQANDAGLKGRAREDFFRNEALATAIGDKGEQFISDARKRTFKDWLNNLWSGIKEHFGIRDLSLKQIQELTLDEFSKKVAADILSGVPLPTGKPKVRVAAASTEQAEQAQQRSAPKPNEERRFTKRELINPVIRPEAKVSIAANLKYVRQTNALSVQEAKRILDSVGEDAAFDLVVRDEDLKPAVRVVLGEILILRYNELATSATDQDDIDYYHDKTIDIANFVAEKLGTHSGQIVQALSLFERLSPEAQLRAEVKEVKKRAEKKRSKRKKDVDAVAKKFKEANEETVTEIVQSKKIQGKVQKAENQTIKKAKDKIEQARTRRENIIKKYKGDKGKNLFSTVPGLTPEGIEYVGNLAKTYLDEGIANVQIIVERILDHLKDAAGKDVTDIVTRNVTDVVSDNYERYFGKRIATGLVPFEKDIAGIIKNHYTVTEDQKRSLKDKFVDDADMDFQEATELAAAIEQEFNEIATRKKMDILHNDKMRFERIKNRLQGSKRVTPQQLYERIIKFSNLGAFENEDLMDMIFHELGTESLSKEEIATIISLAKKIQNAPEGNPKAEATEDLLTYRAQLKGVKFGEVSQAVWYAHILSGYGTHLKNIVSTFFNSMSFFAVAAVRDPRSIPFLVVGGARGLRRGAVEAWHTIKTGRSPIHINKIETPTTLERVKFWGGYFNPGNYLKFVGRLMIAEDVLQFQGLKEMKATQLAFREAKKMGKKNPLTNKEVWKIVNEKLLNTGERYAEASEQALFEEGFTGIEAKRRIYELMERSRPVQMVDESYGFAAKGTFNHEPEGALGALTIAMSGVLDWQVGSVKPLRFAVPFTRIITNVANNLLDYSPVGFIRAARGVRGSESYLGKKYSAAYHEMSADERKDTIAKASLGIGLTLVLYALSKIGGDDDDEPLIEITGGGTGDYRKDIQLKNSGWQPYSIKIGDRYISYALTPLMLNLSWIGNMNDREKYDPKFNEESALKTFTMSVYQSGQMLSDMTWIGSSADLLKSFASLRPSEVYDGATRTLSNSAKGFVIPNAYTQIVQKIEQIEGIPQKEVNDIFDQFIQDIPIARNSLNDKINALGDPVVRDRDLLISSETKDPVWKYLLDKGGWVAPIPKGAVIVPDGKNQEVERLATEDEYYEFSKLRGSKIKAAIKDAMENGVGFNEEGKVTITKDEIKDYKTTTEITSAQLRAFLKSASGRATKQAKAELFNVEE